MSKTRRWLVLATVSAGLLMVSVDTTVLYTALPTLTSDLHADAQQKLWIINAYPLVMAGLLLGAGTLGDRIGHKRMFLTGLVLFAAASLLAAFAPSPPVLIATRAFLAVGAAAMLPATAALIRITFDDEHERGIAIGVWGTMAVLGAALGPIVGGLLLQHFWWGSVFLLNIPVALLALAATAALVPGGSGHSDRPWDLIASLQAMAALAGLVYAIQEAAKPGPMPLAIALALLAAAAGCWMFVRRQRRQAYPLIDFSLFRDRSLLTGVIAAALAMAATVGIDLVLTQRLQLVLGLTPLHAGLIVTAFAAGSLPVGVLAGGLLHRTGVRPLIGGGLLLGALGVLVTLLLTPGAVPLLGAAAGCWMFARRQRRQTHPLIDFTLFRNRNLLAGVIAAALAMAATAGIDLLLTQRLQLVLGLTPLHAGLIVTAFAVGSLPVSVLPGGLLHRTGMRPLIGGGLLLGALGVLVTLLLTPGAVPLLAGGRSPAWVVPGLVLAGAGLGIVMVAGSAAIISGAPPHRAGMASSIESVSYELGSLAGVTVLGTILTAVYTSTIRLPATASAQAAGSIDQARAAAGHLPAGQARPLLDAAASAFDNGYTLALAITAIALAAGSAFTYRYLKRQLTTSTEQAQHPEPAQSRGQQLEPTGSGRRTAPAPQTSRTAEPTTGVSGDRTRVL